MLSHITLWLRLSGLFRCHLAGWFRSVRLDQDQKSKQWGGGSLPVPMAQTAVLRESFVGDIPQHITWQLFNKREIMSSVTCWAGIDYTESCNPLDILSSLQTTKSFHCNWTVTNVHLLSLSSEASSCTVYWLIVPSNVFLTQWVFTTCNSYIQSLKKYAMSDY